MSPEVGAAAGGPALGGKREGAWAGQLVEGVVQDARRAQGDVKVVVGGLVVRGRWSTRNGER